MDSNAGATRLHFPRLDLEENVDWLIVLDGKDAEIQRFTGTYPEGVWSDPVPGNLVKVRLITDSSVQRWGFAVDTIAGAKYTSLAYSPHPYPNYSDLKWTFNNLDAGATATRLHFTSIDLEEGVDWLVIMDLNEVPYQSLTGKHPNGEWTSGIPGNGVIVKLVTDSSVNKWGFNLDRLESTEPEDAQARAESNLTLAESKHPYEDGTVQWKLVNPDAQAAYTKIHFTRLDIANGSLRLFDGNDNPVQGFGDNTHIRDFWSDDVPGRIVKLELMGRWDKSWGFRIDQLVSGITLPALAESRHPYEDGTVRWTLVNPDAQAAFTKVRFSRLAIANGYLRLLDGNDNPFQSFGDNTYLDNVWSDDILGRLVKIEFTGRWDKAWGMRVDLLSSGVPTASLAESRHPYEDGTVTWTLVNPDAQAKYTKAHFHRLDIANGYVRLLDGDGNQVQIFGDNTHAADLWSDDVPGRVIKLELLGRWDKSWGFRVDEVKTGTGSR